jgi:hypothetical protein
MKIFYLEHRTPAVRLSKNFATVELLNHSGIPLTT